MSCSSKAHNHLHDALPHGKPNIFFTQLCRTLTMSLELRAMMRGGHSGRSPASAFISGYIATKLAYKWGYLQFTMDRRRAIFKTASRPRLAFPLICDMIKFLHRSISLLTIYSRIADITSGSSAQTWDDLRLPCGLKQWDYSITWNVQDRLQTSGVVTWPRLTTHELVSAHVDAPTNTTWQWACLWSCTLANNKWLRTYVLSTYWGAYIIGLSVVHIYLRTRTATHSYVCTHASDAQISFYKNTRWPVNLVVTHLHSGLPDMLLMTDLHIH